MVRRDTQRTQCPQGYAVYNIHHAVYNIHHAVYNIHHAVYAHTLQYTARAHTYAVYHNINAASPPTTTLRRLKNFFRNLKTL